MNRPWMPLYVGDYLGDTGHLTTTQHGAYLLLIMHYWRKGGLPDDDKQLAAITKLSPKGWAECRETLQMFFYEGWQHKRIDDEISKMERLSNKRAIAGQKGGISSALGRMKIENAALGRTVDNPRKSSLNFNRATTHKPAYLETETSNPLKENDTAPAIAKQSSTIVGAIVDHSHSQSKKEEGPSSGETGSALVDNLKHRGWVR